MTLPLGSKLGSYEVLSLLGAGGMGEVYRARDTRLGREVAIKVLPAERMADESRRRRFVQEARAASALSHPNIVTIHEIGSADGNDFIVMEYVPGKTLDAVIPRQGMRLGEVLRIAIPVADAVARAHAAGIVHRDLKPANVVIGSDGVVKVLDFGLAKLVALEEAGGPEHETKTEDRDAGLHSRPGTVAGTAGYMSPEQAAGRNVDARTDVFSFGAMLYEMVTGRRAFVGNSTAETLAAVLREQPKTPSDLTPDVPRDLDKVILRCLQKDPDRRFQHMADVKVELQEIREESDPGPAAAPATVRRNRRGWLVAAFGVAILVGAAAWLWWHPRETELPPPRLVSLTSMSGFEEWPTFSPDGDQVAFRWQGEKLDNWDIYLKIIGSSEIRRLTSDPAEDLTPSWSPDGRQIAFVRRRAEGATIHLVSPLGGPDRKVSDFPVAAWQPLSWSPDGRFLAAERDASGNETATNAGGIYLVPLAGGEARPIAQVKASGRVRAPAFSPDGRWLAYASCYTQFEPTQCDVHVLELGEDDLPKGPPRRVTTHAVLTIRSLTWTRDGGAVIFESEPAAFVCYLWRAGVKGDRPPERIELAGPRARTPATVRSRNRLAFTRDNWNVNIYQFEAGRPPQAVLASSFSDMFPQFSPDGRRIVFQSGRSGEGEEIWLAAADGSSPQQITHGPGLWQGSPRWSPDGRRIAFDSQGEDGHWDIWTIDADGGSLRRLTLDPGNENLPNWSSDGRWIYFQTERAGPLEIWRIPVAGGAEERVTRGGGSFAHESADGKTLFHMQAFGDGPLLALPLAGGSERQVLACAPPFGLAVGPGGLYHLGCADGRIGRPIYLLDPATGQDRLLGNQEKNAGYGLTVSPDGKTILSTKWVGEGSDLMMIENFR